MIAFAHLFALSPVLADEDEDQLKALIDTAGPIAMVFVVLLGVALYFLWRSLNKQIKRIDPALPSESEGAASDADPAAGETTATVRDDDVPPSA